MYAYYTWTQRQRVLSGVIWVILRLFIDTQQNDHLNMATGDNETNLMHYFRENAWEQSLHDLYKNVSIAVHDILI